MDVFVMFQRDKFQMS